MRIPLAPKAFTPSREDPHLLDARTIGREGVLKRIHQMLKQTATTKNRPHMLLVGPRGAGKSHVLEVALHRASLDPDLEGRFRIARLPEDALGLASTADVLLEVLRALAPRNSTTKSALDARLRGDVSVLQALIDAELDGLALLLVAENLNLTLQSLGDDGQDDLRGWIEQSGSVTVLASAPLLFHAVQSREAPFFGSFAIEHLDPLTLDQGAELLDAIAAERDDPDLAHFLRSPAGRLRIRAVHHLAGGSPRVWTIFASCISIDTLSDVVPAVENLLEELVGYYQQRMWELSATEQKIVAVLATTGPSQTVTSIANQAGVQRDTANTLLRRLAKAGWVTSTKMPGLDGRESWYELTESLLRHHLQYRNNQGDELRLIVDLLIAWFDTDQRSGHLLRAPSESMQSHYLASALTLDPTRRFDAGYADQDLDQLRATAKAWSLGKTEDLGTVEAGRLLTAVTNEMQHEEVAAALNEVWGSSEPGTATWAVLGLVRWCWSGWDNERLAAAELTAIADLSTGQWPTRVSFGLRHEASFWSGEAGEHATAINLLQQLITDQTEILGPNHPDTLATRFAHAYLLGETGEHEPAIHLLQQLITDYTETLGPNHPDTLTTRQNHAYLLGQSGRDGESLHEYRSMVSDSPSDVRALTGMARLRVKHGLVAGDNPGDGDVVDLLRSVALDGNAHAFALLPASIREILTETN